MMTELDALRWIFYALCMIIGILFARTAVGR